MNVKTITNKLKKLGIVPYSTRIAELGVNSTTYVVLDDGIQVDFWNIGRVIPCKYDFNKTDLIPLSVKILYRKADRINANSYDHVMKDVSLVNLEDFLSLTTWIEFQQLVLNKQSVGIRLVKGA